MDEDQDSFEHEWNYWRERFSSFKPIEVGQISREALVKALEERLAAILDFTKCDATCEGWRELALYLAMDFKFENRRVIDLKSPLDRGGRVGRPQKKLQSEKLLWEMHRLIEEKGEKREGAAEKVSKANGGKPARGTLLKMYSERRGAISRPLSALSAASKYRVEPLHAIEEAAKRLSANYENDR